MTGMERMEVARRVYAVVVSYAEARWLDYEELFQRIGGKTPFEIETMVRELAEEAEGNSIPVHLGVFGNLGAAPQSSRTTVVMETLHDQGIADDYLRMKRGEQWMAFDDIPPEEDRFTDEEMRTMLTRVFTELHGELTDEHRQRIEEAIQKRNETGSTI